MNHPLLILLALTAVACNNPLNKKSDINSKSNKKVEELKYDKTYDMPPDLNEISGISFLNDSVVATIEDENGILYFYNLKQDKIVKKIEFAEADDYEDLAIVGKDIFVVNSSGQIFQIKNFELEQPEIKSINTPFNKKNDIEGLAYQPKLNRLLFGLKGRNLDKTKDSKQVYAYDLKTMQFDTSSVYKLQLDEIESYFSGDAIEESSKKFLKAIGNHNINKVFKSSALAVHPQTNQIFVLSSINNIIAVLTPKGKLSLIIKFDGKDYTQPEGIAFSANNKLYISNEGGKNGKGNIIELEYAN